MTLLVKRLTSHYFSWFALYGFLFLSNSLTLIRGATIILAFLLFLSGSTAFYSLWIALLVVLPFELEVVGITQPVVTALPEINLGGYEYHFGLTLRLFIVLVLFLFTCIKKYRNSNSRVSLPHGLLFAFLFAALISSLLSFDRFWSLTGFISLWEVVFMFVLFYEVFSEKDTKVTFLSYLSGLVFISGLIGSVQFLRGTVLGNILELRSDTTAQFSSGLFTTDGESLYRVSGMTSHATFFSSFLAVVIPAFFGLILLHFLYKNWSPKKMFFLAGAGVLSCVALVGTFSRSSWITVFVSLLFMLWRFKDQLKEKIKLKPFHGIIIFIIIIFGLSKLLGGNIVSRLESISDFLTKGTGTGRVELMRKSVELIQESPLFGVGLHHFTHEMVRTGVKPEFAGFIYPVHNLFLLFAAEVGLLGTICFILFCGVVLWKSFKTAYKDPVLLGIWLGCVSFIGNAQVHTLFNQGPALHFFMIFMAYLLVKQKEEQYE